MASLGSCSLLTSGPCTTMRASSATRRSGVASSGLMSISLIQGCSTPVVTSFFAFARTENDAPNCSRATINIATPTAAITPPTNFIGVHATCLASSASTTTKATITARVITFAFIVLRLSLPHIQVWSPGPTLHHIPRILRHSQPRKLLAPRRHHHATHQCVERVLTPARLLHPAPRQRRIVSALPALLPQICRPCLWIRLPHRTRIQPRVHLHHHRPPQPRPVERPHREPCLAQPPQNRYPAQRGSPHAAASANLKHALRRNSPHPRRPLSLGNQRRQLAV